MNSILGAVIPIFQTLSKVDLIINLTKPTFHFFLIPECMGRRGVIVTKENKDEYPEYFKVIVSIKIHLFNGMNNIMEQQRAFRTDPVHRWLFQRDFDYYSGQIFQVLVSNVGMDKERGFIRVGMI